MLLGPRHKRLEPVRDHVARLSSHGLLRTAQVPPATLSPQETDEAAPFKVQDSPHQLFLAQGPSVLIAQLDRVVLEDGTKLFGRQVLDLFYCEVEVQAAAGLFKLLRAGRGSKGRAGG